MVLGILPRAVSALCHPLCATPFQVKSQPVTSYLGMQNLNPFVSLLNTPEDQSQLQSGNMRNLGGSTSGVNSPTPPTLAPFLLKCHLLGVAQNSF